MLSRICNWRNHTAAPAPEQPALPPRPEKEARPTMLRIEELEQRAAPRGAQDDCIFPI